MPFTPSHAAAVPPAVRGDGTGRWRLVPSVLVAGSFAPDATFYAANALPSAMGFGTFTHSLPEVVTVDVPTARLLAALWLLAREPLVALLPRNLQGRPAALLRCGAPRARVEPSSVARWYLSAATGALTHVAGDAFTHHDRWGVRVFPVLDHRIGGAPGYRCLQYGGSAVAAVAITAFVVHAPLRAVAVEPARAGVPVLPARWRWWGPVLIGGCAAAGAVQRVARSYAADGRGGGLFDLIPAVCFGAGAGLVVGVTAYAGPVRVRHRHRGGAGSEDARSRSGGSGGVGSRGGTPVGPGRVREAATGVGGTATYGFREAGRAFDLRGAGAYWFRPLRRAGTLLVLAPGRVPSPVVSAAHGSPTSGPALLGPARPCSARLGPAVGRSGRATDRAGRATGRGPDRCGGPGGPGGTGGPFDRAGPCGPYEPGGPGRPCAPCGSSGPGGRGGRIAPDAPDAPGGPRVGPGRSGGGARPGRPRRRR
ncbi:DUF4184 family protein [Streptomyces sp. NPDC018057]|uniref:DUF4184 family protein n=1 Tax=Streptomyces sp. NPDC018057 TaxID=3365040 RepID=UPI0037A727BD